MAHIDPFHHIDPLSTHNSKLKLHYFTSEICTSSRQTNSTVTQSMRTMMEIYLTFYKTIWTRTCTISRLLCIYIIYLRSHLVVYIDYFPTYFSILLPFFVQIRKYPQNFLFPFNRENKFPLKLIPLRYCVLCTVQKN